MDRLSTTSQPPIGSVLIGGELERKQVDLTAPKFLTLATRALITPRPHPSSNQHRSQHTPTPPQPGVTQVVPNPTMTNRQGFDLISTLLEQPLKAGDVWFAIPQLWLDDWKKACDEKPDDIEPSIGPVSTSILVGERGDQQSNHADIVSTERAGPCTTLAVLIQPIMRPSVRIPEGS